MSGWLNAVTALRDERQAGVLVTVVQVRGHAPREPGAKMVVSADHTWSTIGGGALEARAITHARNLLVNDAATPETFTATLSEKSPLTHGVQCCGGEVTVLLEPLPVLRSLAIFGMGHVGTELALVLARHELDLHLIDSREEQLASAAIAPFNDPVAQIHVHHVPVIPELVLDGLPFGTDVLIMTHDHAEDLAIVDAALRNGRLGTIGIIGSSSKRSKFRSKLAEAGFSQRDIDRVQIPIGISSVTSKKPAAIAVAIAADWLSAAPRPTPIDDPESSGTPPMTALHED